MLNNLEAWVKSPNIDNTIILAREYFELGQYSAAYSLYLKVAETSTDDLTKYDSLVELAKIYYLLGNRWKGALQYCSFAKSISPINSPLYLLICEILVSKLNHDGVVEQYDWIQVYENAKIGIYFLSQYANDKLACKLKTYYCLGLLRLGKLEELKNYLNDLTLKYEDDFIMDTMIYIYDQIGKRYPGRQYTKDKFDQLTYPTDRVDLIEDNSLTFQSTVASLLPGDRSYLNFESGPISNSNVSSLTNWVGWTVTNNTKLLNDLLLDDKKVIYSDYSRKSISEVTPNLPRVHYLSLANGSASDNLNILYDLDFSECRFDFITFRHNEYVEGVDIRLAANEYLIKNNYICISPNIRYNSKLSYESWYIDKSLLYDEEVLRVLNTIITDDHKITILKDKFL